MAGTGHDRSPALGLPRPTPTRVSPLDEPPLSRPYPGLEAAAGVEVLHQGGGDTAGRARRDPEPLGDHLVRVPQRQQPQRQSRSQRKAAAPKPVPTATSQAESAEDAADPGASAATEPDGSANGQPAKKTNVPAKGVPTKKGKKR